MSLQHRPSTMTSVYSRREIGNYLWMYETVPTSLLFWFSGNRSSKFRREGLPQTLICQNPEMLSKLPSKFGPPYLVKKLLWRRSVSVNDASGTTTTRSSACSSQGQKGTFESLFLHIRRLAH